MPIYKRKTHLAIALVNLFVAGVLLVELWGFHRELDSPGVLPQVPDTHKIKMLRNIHYWGIPPVALLTITSGLWFWRLSKENKT